MSQIINDGYNIQSFNNQLIVRTFTASDLDEEGCLILTDAFPGDVVVINNNGKVLYVNQIQYNQGGVTGVKIDLSDYNVQGDWKLRYNKSSNVNANIYFQNNNKDNLIIYSLIFS